MQSFLFSMFTLKMSLSMLHNTTNNCGIMDSLCWEKNSPKEKKKNVDIPTSEEHESFL